jgi:hypothetical protein
VKPNGFVRHQPAVGNLHALRANIRHASPKLALIGKYRDRDDGLAFQSSNDQRPQPSVLEETVGVIIVINSGSSTSCQEEFRDLFNQRSDIGSELDEGEEL